MIDLVFLLSFSIGLFVIAVRYQAVEEWGYQLNTLMLAFSAFLLFVCRATQKACGLMDQRFEEMNPGAIALVLNIVIFPLMMSTIIYLSDGAPALNPTALPMHFIAFLATVIFLTLFMVAICYAMYRCCKPSDKEKPKKNKPTIGSPLVAEMKEMPQYGSSHV